jgi:Tol biopolymer transport system component
MDRDRSSPALPLSRRQPLAAAGVATAAGAIGTSPATARPSARLTLFCTEATNGSATLSPAGDRLIAEVQNVLWSLSRSGGSAAALTPAGLEPNRPTHSPDGKLIAFCAYQGGGFHLWTVRPDGSDLGRRTDGPWDDRAPAWSPDGTRFAFASERGGDPVTGSPYRIHVQDLRSGTLTAMDSSACTGTTSPREPRPRS